MVYRDLKKTTQTQICFILREIATYAHTSVLTTDSEVPKEGHLWGKNAVQLAV